MKKLMFCLLVCACAGPRFRVDPVKVEPIHVTVDVNVHDKDAAKPKK